ncbi:hypothetical protein [Erythrobacter donghaensis]|jgi:outer membrane cobalamin receptor|uniref:hypothetical protein n=1 Tax=Erythrobacter donghaensis TaxID=267135 RepID=UPI000B19C59E|nr:hypothetical protein [Erythrobacter donghaensis]
MRKLDSLKLGAASLALGIALAASPAYAQDQVADDSAAAEEEGRAIVVTGSRIASAEVESPAPLQIVNEQLIEDSGVINIQELLLENPVFGARSQPYQRGVPDLGYRHRHDRSA